MSLDLPASESLFKEKGNQNALEQSREIQLMFEYETLVHYSPAGIFVIPDIKALHIWYGLIFIRSGVYQGLVLKFLIDIPKDYPLSAPKVFFINPVFHPLVNNETRELNITPRFPQWRAKKDFIFLLLRYIKSIFLQKELWVKPHIKNEVAYSMMDNEPRLREYARKCAESKDEIKQLQSWFSKIFQIEESKESEEILDMFRKINSEENVKEFLEWFNNLFQIRV